MRPYLKNTGAALLAAGLSLATAASSAVVIEGTEIGGDVVFSYSGSLDLTGLTTGANRSFTFGWAGDNGGRGLFYSLSGYTGFTGTIAAPVFGAPLAQDGTRSGDSFGIQSSSVFTNVGYTSGTAINGSLTFAGRSLSDMGYTIGESFLFTMPSDTVTLNIGSVSTVPLPAGLPLLLAGIGALGLMARRKAA